ncbi:MAG: hypothetical protein JRI72_00610 [Deltaproteobacteria bacterium]|nr:hypothetical protein [Deltaproteobacteria bacterium]
MSFSRYILIKFFSVLFLICLIAPAAWAEGPYYFKNGGNDSLDGLSDANAWANPSVKLDGQSFDDGTDFYFKQGDTFTVSNDIDINHSGVDGNNYTIIGCYEDTGDFDCSGARPIIQKSGGYGIISLNDPNGNSYMRFDHLDLRDTSESWQDSGSTGITTKSDGDGGNQDQGHIIINDCYLYHFGIYALQLARMGDYNIVTNNELVECGNAIYFIDEVNEGSSYNYIAGNTCTDIVGYDGHDGHCVGLQRVKYTIVEDNTGNDAYGPIVIWSENSSYYTHDNVVRDNIIYGANVSGVSVEGGGNAGAIHNLVYRNIITENGAINPYPGIRLAGFDNAGSAGNRVFNNTIYNSFGMGLGIGRAALTADNVWFLNNIVWGNTTYYLFDNQNAPQNITINYNLYWASSDPSAQTLWKDTNGTAYDWNDWTTSRSRDINSPSPADPKFTTPGSNDFTLQKDSPAIDAGFYLSHVSQSGSSTTTVNVADSYWFHGDYGLVDEDGNAITGMQITLYDTTNGHQDVIITSDTITHGTPGSFVVNTAVDYIYNGDHLTDPAYTTQIGLTFYGVSPDIGAEEYALAVFDVSPADGDTGVSTTASATWDYASFVDDVDVWLDKAACSACDCDGSLVSDDDADKTYDMSTLDTASTYCLGLKANDGANQGDCQEFEFTTAGGPPPDPSGKPDMKYSASGGNVKFSASGGDMK